MQIKMFAVFDEKLGAYATPFCVQTVGVAVRMFTDLVSDPSSQLHAHPEDYHLYELCSYDDQTGMMTQDGPPRHVCRAFDVYQGPLLERMANGGDGEAVQTANQFAKLGDDPSMQGS